MYSTQAPDNSVSYFLAYHPSCGDEITTWKTGEESLPSVSSLRITPDVPVIGEKLKGDYLYVAADSGAEEKNSLRTWTVWKLTKNYIEIKEQSISLLLSI
ncbi:hypothetical protein AAFX60_020450 [Aliivibrio fischeri]